MATKKPRTASKSAGQKERTTRNKAKPRLTAIAREKLEHPERVEQRKVERAKRKIKNRKIKRELKTI